MAISTAKIGLLGVVAMVVSGAVWGCANNTEDDSTNALPSGTSGTSTLSGGGATSGGATSGGATSGGATSGGATSGDAGTASACHVLCDNAAANCQGEHEQYPDRDGCLALCAALPEGAPGDVVRNTAWCRANAAGEPAIEDAARWCPIASIGSKENRCGAVCEGYCSQVTAHCTGENAQYASEADCLMQCNGAADGRPGDTDLATNHCRLHYAGLPALQDPDTHCPNAGLSSDACFVIIAN